MVGTAAESETARMIGPASAEAYDTDAESDEGQGMRLSISALFRSKRLILGIFFALSAVALPPVWLLVVPKYSATASIRIAPEIPKLVYERDATSPWYGPYVNTQIANLTNPALLQRVLEREKVQRTTWYTEEPQTLRTFLGGAPPGHLRRLRSAISAKNRANTELVDVEVVAAHASDADIIVDTVVEEYMRYVAEATNEADELLFEALRDQRRALEKRMEGLVERMGNLSKQMGTNDPDIVRSQLAEQLGELDMAHKNLTRDHQLVLWALALQDGEDTSSADDGQRYAADPEWAQLNSAWEAAQQEVQMARLRYGELHPRIEELQAKIDHARQLLKQREAQLGPGWRGVSATIIPPGEDMIMFMDQGTRRWLADKQQREIELLDEQIASLKSEQEKKGELAKQIAQLSDEHHREREEYERVVARLRALEMEQKAPGRISVAAWAVTPTTPSHDRRLALTLMVLVGAMMTGLVVAHLRVSLNPTVYEADDVQHTVRVPFLGQLPAEPAATLLARASTPLIAECMRMVRTALLERFSGVGNKAILITSASAGAGKTSVALELAKSLAHLGKKTLLVEADLRRPTLGGRLNLAPGAGLAALLSGAAKHRQVIVHSSVPRLDIIPAGEMDEEFDPELLANGVFSACLTRWKQAYDFVLVDSPPILPVADARIIAGEVDGTIMVSRASHCRRTDVIQACADVTAAGGPLLGTVLVGVQQRSGYGYSNGYYSEQAK